MHRKFRKKELEELERLHNEFIELLPPPRLPRKCTAFHGFVDFAATVVHVVDSFIKDRTVDLPSFEGVLDDYRLGVKDDEAKLQEYMPLSDEEVEKINKFLVYKSKIDEMVKILIKN